MKTLTWILKFIVFPLLPFFFGAGVRILQRGAFEFNVLSPAELAFSMAMLTLIISVSTSRIQNATLRDALTQSFQLGAVVYLALFAWAIFLETDMQSSWKGTLAILEAKVRSNTPVGLQDFSSHTQAFLPILERLRWITITLSCVVIPLAVYTNKKYDLENL